MMIKVAKKKTFSVSDFKDQINKMNKDSICGSDLRKGWNLVLEEILHKTGNYDGYMMLVSKNVPDGHLPGINDMKEGEKNTHESLFVNTDKTRVRYF